MTIPNSRQHADILADFDRLCSLGKAPGEARRVAVQNARRSGIEKDIAEVAIIQYARFRGSSVASDGVVL